MLPAPPAAAHCIGDEELGVVRRGLAVLCNSTRLGSNGGGTQFRRVSQVLLHPSSPEAAAGAQSLSTDRGGKQRPGMEEGAFTAGDVGLLLLDSPIEGLAPVKVATPRDWQVGGPRRCEAALQTSPFLLHIHALGRWLKPLMHLPSPFHAASQRIAFPGVALKTVGWGATGGGGSPGSFPRTLQEATLPYVSPER